MTAGMFRKKPVMIRAVRWSPMCENADEVLNFAVDELGLPVAERHGAAIRITTSEGVMTASPGDFIIQGVKGEFYPCKPDIFVATYEALDKEGLAMMPDFPEGIDP